MLGRISQNMKKVYVSYRFTGEDPDHLETVLSGVRDSLRSSGHDVFCSLWLEEYFRGNGMVVDDIYDYCVRAQEDQDIHLSVIWSPQPSKGMVLELNRASELGQHRVLAIKPELEFPAFRSQADRIIEYTSFPELFKLVKSI